MKLLKLLSVICVLSVITLIVYSYTKQTESYSDFYYSDEIAEDEYPMAEAPGDSIGNYETPSYEFMKVNDTYSSIDTKFLVKLVFSGIFTLAALYVILSPQSKYDAETKKWAFSIISLVTGIWLGTAV